MKEIPQSAIERQYQANPTTVVAGQTRRIGDTIRMGIVILFEARKRKPHSYNRHQNRIREIEKLVKVRHGYGVPETDDADIYIEAVAYAYQAEMWAGGTDASKRLLAWCSVWAPWATTHAKGIINPILSKLNGRRQGLDQHRMGNMLRLTWAERQSLGLRTIAACDVEPDEQKRRAKDIKCKNDRARKAAMRREQGAKKRDEWLASCKSQIRPWEAEGISRRTWYRRRAKSAAGETIGTGSSQIDIHTVCDTPVPAKHTASIDQP